MLRSYASTKQTNAADVVSSTSRTSYGVPHVQMLSVQALNLMMLLNHGDSTRYILHSQRNTRCHSRSSLCEVAALIAAQTHSSAKKPLHTSKSQRYGKQLTLMIPITTATRTANDGRSKKRWTHTRTAIIRDGKWTATGIMFQNAPAVRTEASTTELVETRSTVTSCKLRDTKPRTTGST